MILLLPTADGFTATVWPSQVARALITCATRVGHVARFHMIATSTDKALVEFVTGLSLGDVPGSTRARLGLLLADMAAVCTAGRPAPASAMAAGYAAAAHPGA